jgi:hypothetical protein
LWVASVKGAAGETRSIVHKLQLVSGRGLLDFVSAEALLPVRIVDLAVQPDGTVLALDAAGQRLLRIRPGARALEETGVRIGAPDARVLAAATDQTAFVGTAAGVLRVDLTSRSVRAVKSVDDLSGFTSLAWRNGALVGVQRAAGAWLVVRVALDGAGTRAQPRAVLAASPSPLVGSLADGRFYFLEAGAIKHVPIR